VDHFARRHLSGNYPLLCRCQRQGRSQGAMLMSRSFLNRLAFALGLLLGTVFSSSSLLKAQTDGLPRSVDITVQVLDGRNDKPVPVQRVLVFVGASSEAAKSHAEHTDLTTDKNGLGLSESTRTKRNGCRCGPTDVCSVIPIPTKAASGSTRSCLLGSSHRIAAAK